MRAVWANVESAALGSHQARGRSRTTARRVLQADGASSADSLDDHLLGVFLGAFEPSSHVWTEGMMPAGGLPEGPSTSGCARGPDARCPGWGVKGVLGTGLGRP